MDGDENQDMLVVIVMLGVEKEDGRLEVVNSEAALLEL